MHTARQTAEYRCPEPMEYTGLHLAPTTYVDRVAGAGEGGRIASRPTLFLSGGSALPAADLDPAQAAEQPGVRMTVLHGDPSRPGLFVVRLQLPAGYEIAPHAHPTAEFITVISGTLRVGLEASRRCTETVLLSAGDYMTIPAGQRHYALAVVPTVVQLDAVGPFDLTHVHRPTAPRALRR